ncbi:MAG: TrkA family potassium uptake protein [Chloroflexi bacterium]|nr:TrkA family potassium uptake protein [Chloroflexota bacterium]
MNVVIMGCGRVGAQLAGMLDANGHRVTVLDLDSYSFRRLPSGYRGTALIGNGLDEEHLKRAGIEEADVFVAVTQGDNRNLMACQIARHNFNVKKVICRIYDPLRQELYATLGIESVSSTTVVAELLKTKIEG